MTKILSQKHNIARSFSKSAKSYNDWALPQDHIANLLAVLPNDSTLEGNLLDAGCGTGLLSQHLLSRKNNITLTGLDISEAMLYRYQSINPNIRLGDLEKLPFQDQSFTHYISSFSLHWTDLEKSVAELSRVTSHTISIALPIEESLKLFGFPFPSKNKVLDLLLKENIRVDSYKLLRVEVPFSGLKLFNYFHFTGTSYSSNNGKLPTKSYIEEWLNKCKDQDFYYDVLFVLGHKK